MPLDIIVCELVDVYFDQADWFFALLEPVYFKKIFSAWQTANAASDRQPDPACSDHFQVSALLFQIMAVALQFVPSTAFCISLLRVSDFASRDTLSERYSENGAQIMSALGNPNPTLTGVQHDQMRALWLKNNSRGKDAWFAMGDAIRSVRPISSRYATDADVPAEGVRRT